MGRVAVPDPGRAAAERWVADHLGDLFDDAPRGSDRHRGGQSAADAALAAFDVAGYASDRNEVLPVDRRGASGLSPWVRHGLLPLPFLWEAVADGPPRDVARFRDELLWQEYARHLYARIGTAGATDLRFTRPADGSDTGGATAWDRHMACVDHALAELEADGWLVNQARMWLASDWSVRHGQPWQEGEDRFFTHLLDGSRAANRLGWQWVAGRATGRPYGFSREQVERRAPGLCASCARSDACPITNWPDAPDLVDVPPGEALASDPDVSRTAGPTTPLRTGVPDAVWLTAESLGDADPALAVHRELPAVFVFDRPLLGRLRLSAKRLVFLAETLADLATRREVELRVGDPVAELSGRRLAATHAPVPGFRTRSAALEVVELHPWPWLVAPHDGPAGSFSAWRRATGR